MTVYYTYYSYEEFGRGYIGYRKCPKGISPEQDSYLGSYKDKTFKPTAKIIITTHRTKREAILAEIKIQKLFSVVENHHFANRSYQTNVKFSFSAQGSNHPMYNKTHSEEAKGKMSKARKGKKLPKEQREKLLGKNSPRHISRDWHHPDHGDILDLSLSELTRMFLEQNLDTSSLSKVAVGRIFQTHGWRLLENKNVDIQYGTPRSWCHVEHGFTYNMTVSDIIRKYPGQKLSIAGLCNLCFGRSASYKGWIFIDDNLIDKSLSEQELSEVFSKDYAITKIGQIKRISRQKMSDSRKNSSRMRRDWHHPNHGVLKQVSVYELVRMFPDLKLQPTPLYLVIHGKKSFYRGWTVLKPEQPGDSP